MSLFAGGRLERFGSGRFHYKMKNCQGTMLLVGMCAMCEAGGQAGRQAGREGGREGGRQAGRKAFGGWGCECVGVEWGGIGGDADEGGERWGRGGRGWR